MEQNRTKLTLTEPACAAHRRRRWAGDCPLHSRPLGACRARFLRHRLSSSRWSATSRCGLSSANASNDWNTTNSPSRPPPPPCSTKRTASGLPARRSREQFEKIFIPGFTVALLLAEAAGVYFLWRWLSKAGRAAGPASVCPGHLRRSSRSSCSCSVDFPWHSRGWKSSDCSNQSPSSSWPARYLCALVSRRD